MTGDTPISPTPGSPFGEGSPVPWLKANWIVLAFIFVMGGAYAESRLKIHNLEDKVEQQSKVESAFQELKSEVQTQNALTKQRDEFTEKELGEIKELLEKLIQ
jgi:predicted RND superfamily exporter protein